MAHKALVLLWGARSEDEQRSLTLREEPQVLIKSSTNCRQMVLMVLSPQWNFHLALRI